MIATAEAIEPTAPRLALNAAEAAEALGISTRTLSTWTDEGIIPVVEIGGRLLYPVDVLRGWLAERAAAKKRPGCVWICRECGEKYDRRPEKCKCQAGHFTRHRPSLDKSQAGAQTGAHD